jgi:hypothetical protein
MKTQTRKKTTRRKTRTRIGTRALLLLALLLLCFFGASAGEKQQSYAVVAGTVFREPGFTLPGAEVVLRTTVPPPGVKHAKSLRVRSDRMGEYAFRVPRGKAEYSVSVKADGFVGEEKPAKIESEERVDIYFTLRAVK